MSRIPPNHTVSVATSRKIFDDATRVHEDPSHPCRRFITLQHGVSPDRWQLPIPFMGATAIKGVVFLGLNPSYDPNEASPRWGVGFDEWDTFWRSAFDAPSDTWPRLYRWYQRIGERAFGDFVLGRDALVLEIVHFRSERSEACDDPDVLQHELPMTLALLTEVSPAVILCSGSKVLWRMRELLPGLSRALPDNYNIRAVEGEVLRCDAPWGPIAVIGARHLTGAFGWSAEGRLALGDAVRTAISELRLTAPSDH